MKQRGFFDEYDKLKELSNLGDPLEKLNSVVNWEIFRPILNRVLTKETTAPGRDLLTSVSFKERSMKFIQNHSITILTYSDPHPKILES